MHHCRYAQIRDFEATAAAAGTAAAAFAAKLAAFTQLRSSYAELDAVKPLCAAAITVAKSTLDNSTTVHSALELLASLLLLPGSRPIARQLLSCLRPLLQQPANGSSTVSATEPGLLAGVMAARLRVAADTVTAMKKHDPAVAVKQALLLGGALETALAQPALHMALRPHAAALILAVSWGLDAALGDAVAAIASTAVPQAAVKEPAAPAAKLPDRDAAVPAAPLPSAVADGIQESVSALYSLLTAFGQSLFGDEQKEQSDSCCGDDPAAAAAVTAAGTALLRALSGSMLAREALSSAAVALYAAAALPPNPPAVMAADLAEGLRLLPGAANNAAAAAAADQGVLVSVLDAALRHRGSSLVADLMRMPELSRVCALRGLLAALPAEVLCWPLAYPTDAAAGPAGDSSGAWQLLRDGALPSLCAAIQGAPDAHFRFHAVSALAVGIDRCRALVQQAAAGENSEQLQQQQQQQQRAGGSPRTAGRAAQAASAWPARLPPPALGPPACRQLLGVLWAGWEDPLPQTVQRVHEAFASLLDCLEAQRRLPHASAAAGCMEQGAQQSEQEGFALQAARQLLAMDRGRKGKYAPLAAVAARLGAAPLLELQPGLLTEAIAATADSVVANPASTLLAVLLQQRREELRADARRLGGAAAAGSDPDEAWRAWCLPPMAAALASPCERQRGGAATYCLPPLLALEPSLLPLLLRALLCTPGVPAPAAATAGAPGGGCGGGAALGCLAVLKAGRQLGLVSDLGQLGGAAGLDAARLAGILQQALSHPSEGLRMDALQLVCCHPRTSTLPSALELSSAGHALALALRCSSSGLRSRTLQATTRLLQRTRGGVALALAQAGAGGGDGRDARAHTAPATAEPLPPAVAAVEAWLQGLSERLVLSLYPGAPYQRTYMAAELLGMLLDHWGDLLAPELVGQGREEGNWAALIVRAALFSAGAICIAFLTLKRCLRRPALLQQWQAPKDGSGRLPLGAFLPFSPLLSSPGAVRLLLAAALDR